MGRLGIYLIPKTEKDFFTIYNQILSKGEKYYDVIYPTCIVHMLKDHAGLSKGQKLFAFYGDKNFDDMSYLLGFVYNGDIASQYCEDFIHTLDERPDMYYVAGENNDYMYHEGDSLCIINDKSSYEDIPFIWPSQQTDFMSKCDTSTFYEEDNPPSKQQITGNLLKDYGITLISTKGANE